ncbi:MAG TPA: cupin domain-containing protein [Gaiellaceae bacterium]|nr:cupin domain-containing protein [Gaiellaceae bacterium]
MASAGDTIRNPATGETLTFVVTSGDSDGRLLRVDVTADPGKEGPPLHVHRGFVERYEVVEGRLRITLRGEEHVVAAPGRFEIPRGAPHTFRVEGAEPARMVVDFEPAGTYEGFLVTMYGLAEDGKTNAKGVPNILQTAVVGREHLGDFALARPPYLLQKLLFAVLAPIGRLAGYPSHYERS